MKKKDREDIRKNIIITATRLFAEQGYQKTTITDISKEVGLVESAIYEYFQGKEDLLFSIPFDWASESIEELEEQLYGIEGSFNKLRKFYWWYLRIVEKNPHTAVVIFLLLQTNRDFLQTEIYSQVKSLFSSLIKIFEEGKNSGEMRKDLDPYEARAIFWGTINNKVTRWLLKGRSYPLTQNLDHSFSLLKGAFRPQEQ
jgi:TetR/AcrR family transcriptional regulator, fatty acid metabolism regulator protein